MNRHKEKKPQELALEVLQLGKAVSPGDINKHVATGNYASKYICFLRRLGFEFEVKKDGLSVVSYTLIKEPANAAMLRSGTKTRIAHKVKIAEAKPAKVAKVTKVTKTISNLEKIKAVAQKITKVKQTKTPLVEKVSSPLIYEDNRGRLDEMDLKELGLEIHN